MRQCHYLQSIDMMLTSESFFKTIYRILLTKNIIFAVDV